MINYFADDLKEETNTDSLLISLLGTGLHKDALLSLTQSNFCLCGSVNIHTSVVM